jgi:hypothetical protein
MLVTSYHIVGLLADVALLFTASAAVAPVLGRASPAYEPQLCVLARQGPAV